ncbi:MAG: hypothetical protein LBD82_07855 [Deltaproteobacteria bacterium]|nr:hypothetical protein [Deltaproteobacteria bacterium]
MLDLKAGFIFVGNEFLYNCHKAVHGNIMRGAFVQKTKAAVMGALCDLRRDCQTNRGKVSHSNLAFGADEL